MVNKLWRFFFLQIVEEAYNLVQTQLAAGLQSLHDECKKSSKEMEGIIRSDMDQIISSKEFTAGKLKGDCRDMRIHNVCTPFSPSTLLSLYMIQSPLHTISDDGR